MRCKHCDKEIPEDSNFCEWCGTAVVPATIMGLLIKRKKLEAVKHYCEIYHVGLKEAKEAIDKLERNI